MGYPAFEKCDKCGMRFDIRADTLAAEHLRCPTPGCWRPHWVETHTPPHDSATGFFNYGMTPEQYGRWVNLLAKQPVRA